MFDAQYTNTRISIRNFPPIVDTTYTNIITKTIGILKAMLKAMLKIDTVLFLTKYEILITI